MYGYSLFFHDISCCNENVIFLLLWWSKQDSLSLVRHAWGISWTFSGWQEEKTHKITRRQEWWKAMHIAAVQTPKPRKRVLLHAGNLCYVLAELLNPWISQPRDCACGGRSCWGGREGIGSAADLQSLIKWSATGGVLQWPASYFCV